MSSEAILANPAFFVSTPSDIVNLAQEFLQMVREYPDESDIKSVRSHIHKFLHAELKTHTDLRAQLTESKNVDEIESIIGEIRERRKENDNAGGWYYRYWDSLKIEKENTPMFTMQEWDQQIACDAMFNKEIKAKRYDDENVNDCLIGSKDFDFDLANFL